MPTQTATVVDSSVFIIDRIEASASENHEHGLLTRLGVHDDDKFRSSVNTVRASPANLPVDNGRPVGLTAAQSRLIDVKIACGARELNATCPLQPGEQETTPVRGGLLSRSWQHLPAGTPVVTRTTNFWTVHVAWPGLRLVNNEVLEPTKPTLLATGAADPCWAWDRPIPDTADSKLLFNTISTVLSAGLSISGFGFLVPFLTFFGSQEFKAVSLKDVFQIATCAAQKVAKAQDIEDITNALSAMDQELKDTYLPAKLAIKGLAGSARTERMQHAEDIGISILTNKRGNLGALTGDDLGFDGLVPYAVQASAVLALYQELSTVDASVQTPAQSTYITSMKLFATEAADHVLHTVDSIKSTRRNAIVLVMHEGDITRCSGGLSPICVVVGRKIIGASWEDQISGASSGNKNYVGYTSDSDGRIQSYISQCRASMDEHATAVMQELDTKLQPLVDAANTFNKIPSPPPLG